MSKKKKKKQSPGCLIALVLITIAIFLIGQGGLIERSGGTIVDIIRASKEVMDSVPTPEPERNRRAAATDVPEKRGPESTMRPEATVRPTARPLPTFAVNLTPAGPPTPPPTVNWANPKPEAYCDPVSQKCYTGKPPADWEQNWAAPVQGPCDSKKQECGP